MPELHVQVCYARTDRILLQDLMVPAGTTVEMAIMQSGMLAEIPEFDRTSARVGVYGKLRSMDAVLRDGDRVEIYRPLVADPKESRRKRALKREENRRS